MLAVIVLGIVALAGIAVFWWYGAALVPRFAVFFAAIGVGVVVWFAWTERPQLTVPTEGEPVVLAIAIDLSPSMLAQPAPSATNAVPPRFERALQVIATVIDDLEASNDHYLVSVTGFAGDAGVLVGWHDNLAEVREILKYTVTPELFGDNGTSLDAAARLIVDMFALLPPRFDEARRVVLLVSDGEDTVRSSDVRYAVERLERSDASIIALQVGLLERKEGIPVYSDMGKFQGFRVLGGRRYTQPSPEAMRAFAEVREGTYVRAEDPSASSHILEQLRLAPPAVAIDQQLMPVLGLFVLTFLSLVLVIK